MKNKIISITLTLMVLAGIVLHFPVAVSAAVCTVATVPSAASVNAGNTFDVSVRINTDYATRGLQFVVNWDASKVQCDSITKGTYYSDFAAAHAGDVFYLPASCEMLPAFGKSLIVTN